MCMPFMWSCVLLSGDCDTYTVQCMRAIVPTIFKKTWYCSLQFNMYTVKLVNFEKDAVSIKSLWSLKHWLCSSILFLIMSTTESGNNYIVIWFNSIPLFHSAADKFQLQKENGICWPNQPNEACCRINKDNRLPSEFPTAT